MKTEEAIEYIKSRCIGSAEKRDGTQWSDAMWMAIEALKNEINCVKCVHYTERETYTGIKGVCKMDTAHREDLISRSRAIKEVSEWATDILHPQNLIKEDTIYILESLPSADAVEVVLCKDCKHYQNEHICQYFSRFGTIETPSYGYCCFGERREP